uniref:Eukaryotic translation initiation factor 3 subunit H n=1 Tax=Wuchereria bancrofti TaxID=6293 RepID=A0AAF5RWV8_WUCBA
MSTISATVAGPSIVQFVQIDSLVVMKIVKHVDSEMYAGLNEVAGEACQGLLTGLVSIDDRRLEITNCFPTARAEPMLDGDEIAQNNAFYEEQKQAEMLDMLRKFRDMNIDYELVGFYQAHPFGACFAQETIDSLIDYQASVPDGVVLIYDPVKTRQGQLNIRAYRLSTKALEMSLDGDWSPESTRTTGLTYENMLEELPVVIKNSHLVNVMLAELALEGGCAIQRSSSHLELGTRRSLEKCLRSLMSDVDDLNRTVMAYTKYVADKQRYDLTIYNAMQKRQAENEQREARGEPPLSFDDIKKMKPPQLTTKCGMLESFLCSSDARAHSDYAAEVTSENIAKLFLAEAVVDSHGSRDRGGAAASVR